MNDVATEFIHSAAGFGPGWFLGLILIAVMSVLAWVFLKQHSLRAQKRLDIEEQRVKKELEIEDKRETRKQEEMQARIEHDREMAEVKGQMATVMQEANVLMAGVKSVMESVVQSNQILHDDLKASQVGSRQMQSDMKDVKQKVDLIYAKEI